MRWSKRKLVYVPEGTSWWARSYAHVPTVEIIGDQVIRVYFASLDHDKHGRIGYVDLDIDAPHRIVKVASQPVLDIGEPGAFDDSGVTPSCILNVGSKKYMYYTGWQRSDKVPYLLFTGLAVGENDGSFRKFSRVPVLERTDQEPFLRSAPMVIADDGLFRAWYSSGVGWFSIGSVTYPQYVIRAATSSDGVHWTGQGCCIDFENNAEFGFARPWVLRGDDCYRMWYSIRSRVAPYRIGYAESRDGRVWTRKDDESGIAASKFGWDSEMICYASVVSIKGRWYMFYNGNQHGASGFGYATLEE